MVVCGCLWLFVAMVVCGCLWLFVFVVVCGCGCACGGWWLVLAAIAAVAAAQRRQQAVAAVKVLICASSLVQLTSCLWMHAYQVARVRFTLLGLSRSDDLCCGTPCGNAIEPPRMACYLRPAISAREICFDRGAATLENKSDRTERPPDSSLKAKQENIDRTQTIWTNMTMFHLKSQSLRL